MSTQTPIVTAPSRQDDLRQKAITQIRRKRALQAHALAYFTVNMFLFGFWFVTTPGGFYWPVFPLLGWGIGMAFHVWDVFSPTNLSEDRIEREMRRLTRS
jgi:hypothetical protein